MLNLTWAESRTVLRDGAETRLLDAVIATMYDADLIAATDDADTDGSLHMQGCPEAAKEVQVSFELPWNLALQVVPEHCWCTDPANTNLPDVLRAIHYAGELETANEKSWSQTVSLIAEIVALTHRYHRWGNKPEVSAAPLLEFARAAAVKLGHNDKVVEFVHRNPQRYATGLRHLDDTKVAAPAPDVDASDLLDWYSRVVADSVWVDASRLSYLPARYAVRLWIPTDHTTHGTVLALVPRSGLTNTGAFHSVVVKDPHASSADLHAATAPRSILR